MVAPASAASANRGGSADITAPDAGVCAAVEVGASGFGAHISAYPNRRAPVSADIRACPDHAAAALGELTATLSKLLAADPLAIAAHSVVSIITVAEFAAPAAPPIISKTDGKARFIPVAPARLIGISAPAIAGVSPPVTVTGRRCPTGAAARGSRVTAPSPFGIWAAPGVARAAYGHAKTGAIAPAVALVREFQAAAGDAIAATEAAVKAALIHVLFIMSSLTNRNLRGRASPAPLNGQCRTREGVPGTNNWQMHAMGRRRRPTAAEPGERGRI